MLSQHVCLSLEQFPCRKWAAEATLRITKKMVALSVIKKFASFRLHEFSSSLLNKQASNSWIDLSSSSLWLSGCLVKTTPQRNINWPAGLTACSRWERMRSASAARTPSSNLDFSDLNLKAFDPCHHWKGCPVDRHGYGSGVPVWPKNGARARGLFHKKRVCMISACLVPGFISNLVIRCANSDLCLPFAEKNLVCPCKAWKACCLAFHSSRLCN